MSTDSTPYGHVAQHFDEVLRQVADDQWTNATPCVGWNVTDLTSPVIATHQRVYAMVDARGVPSLRAGVPTGERWTSVTLAMIDALNDGCVAQPLARVRTGEQSFSRVVEGLLMFDTLCHTWDLARAVGAVDTLGPDAVRAAHERLAPESAAIRGPGGFAGAIEPDPRADAQRRFLNFVGRAC